MNPDVAPSSFPPSPRPSTLILVCCHAIFIGPTSIATTATITSSNQQSPSRSEVPLNPNDPTQWLLQSFQATEAPTFIKHIQTGLDLLQADPASILVFSGGRTRSAQGCEMSEAEGYVRVARWLLNERGGYDVKGLMRRGFLEEYATDSFQNVLFALLGWSVWTNQPRELRQSLAQLEFPSLPQKLIIVSHNFKRARFMNLHLPAIREPVNERARQVFNEMEVEYVGIDPPFSDEERKEVEEGERMRGYEPWVRDHFGTGEVLGGKRRTRGWDGGVEYLAWWRERLRGIEVNNKDVERVVREIEGIIDVKES